MPKHREIDRYKHTRMVTITKNQQQQKPCHVSLSICHKYKVKKQYFKKCEEKAPNHRQGQKY